MNLSRGRVFRIGLLLVSPYACNGSVPLGDKGLSAPDGGSSQQTGGSANQGGASSGLGGVPAVSGGTSSTGGSISNTGGTTASSTKATGGSSGTGGTKSGTSPATGGKAGGGTTGVGGGATGGAAPGGGNSTGGTKTTGGSGATGGTKAVGGAGGSATGGAATGGAANTGGTSPITPTCVTSTNNTWNSPVTVTTPTSGTADVSVNDTSTSQTWDGFGGCFNELGWKYLSALSTDQQTQALQLLFGTDGCNFAWGRIPIGASDYATSRYTLDDPATNNDPTVSGETARPAADTSLANYKIDRDKQLLIPYIQAAQKVKSDIRFWASPWTPPVWMKTGYKTDSGSGGTAKRASYYDGGNYVSGNSADLNAYAQYYTKWVTDYKAAGINVELVSPQNEPGYDQNYPSCLWDQATYVAWFKVLGAAMQSINVKLMLGTLSNAGDNNRTDLDISSAVLADSTAKGYATVVGAQWGVLDKVNGGQTFGGLPVWATEHKCGNYPWNPSTGCGESSDSCPAYNSTQAPNDQAYGVESWKYIRNAITKGKVTAYSAWNMVLDKVGLGIDTSRDWRQDALLVVDGSVKTTQAYYVFRHFAQFVQPKAVVVGTTGGDAVAFKNPDGTIVAVMYNSGAAKATYTVKIAGKLLQFSMPANGWATVVSQ